MNLMTRGDQAGQKLPSKDSGGPSYKHSHDQLPYS